MLAPDRDNRARVQRQPVAIRPATAADAAAVRALFGALHTFNATLDPLFALAVGWERVLEEHLAHARQAGHGLTLVAWDRREPVGLLIMDSHSDSPLFQHRHWAELLALYVVPAAQGRGVADQLLAEGLVWARARGYDRVQLYLTASNLRAKRFYARAGFRPVQEIWRLGIAASGAAPPADAACDARHAQHHGLLSVSSHPMSGRSGDA